MMDSVIIGLAAGLSAWLVVRIVSMILVKRREAPGEPELMHSFLCKRCGSEEHSRSRIVYMKFTDGESTCLECGGKIMKDRNSFGVNPFRIAIMETTVGEEPKKETEYPECVGCRHRTDEHSETCADCWKGDNREERA